MKPDIKDICKNVKQLLLFSLLFCLENRVFLIISMLVMLTRTRFVIIFKLIIKQVFLLFSTFFFKS